MENGAVWNEVGVIHQAGLEIMPQSKNILAIGGRNAEFYWTEKVGDTETFLRCSYVGK